MKTILILAMLFLSLQATGFGAGWKASTCKYVADNFNACLISDLMSGNHCSWLKRPLKMVEVEKDCRKKYKIDDVPDNCNTQFRAATQTTGLALLEIMKRCGYTDKEQRQILKNLSSVF